VGTCSPVYGRLTLIQYILGEYRLASGGEKTAPGTVRRRFSCHMITDARGCLGVRLKGNERRPNILGARVALRRHTRPG
jgi:hypothetical protein